MSLSFSGDFELSPLHAYWAARPGATAWRGHGRLLLPDEISDRRTEAAAFGASAAFSDISNRTLWSIEGVEAIEFLCALTGDDPAFFRPGHTAGVVWCDAGGYARGSGHVAVQSMEKMRLATEVHDAAWIGECAQLFDVQVNVVPAAGLRLAGPLASETLVAGGIRQFGDGQADAPGIGPIWAMSQKRGAIDLWCAPDEAIALAWVLERAGACPAGGLALDDWRIANGLLAAGTDWAPIHMATDPAAIRHRADLTEGGYLRVAWDETPPNNVRTAVYWTASAQFLSLLWAPRQNGRQPLLPGNGHILGPAATD